MDPDHKHPCRVGFDGRITTIRFRASLLGADDEVEVQFTTAKSHETDAAPEDISDDEWGHADLVVISG